MKLHRSFSRRSRRIQVGSRMLCAVLGFLALTPRGSLRAESDGEVAAREVALELAGAFSNDGYKIRDGHFAGQLQPHTPKIVVVNLYAGDQYYFSLGATAKARKVSVIVYDETGHEVGGEELYQDKARAAAGVTPTASGPYYAKVELLEGDPADFCLVYSYK